MENYIGFIAAFLTTVSFVPQVIQILKTKNTDSISLNMYIIFCLGVFMWLIFGLIKNEYSIIIANAITLLLGISILILKIKNEIKQKQNNKKF